MLEIPHFEIDVIGVNEILTFLLNQLDLFVLRIER